MPSSKKSTDCSGLAVELGKLAVKYGNDFKSLDKAINAVRKDYPDIARAEVIDAISQYSSDTGNSAIDLLVKRQRLRQLAGSDPEAAKYLDDVNKQLGKLRGASKQEVQMIRRMDKLRSDLRDFEREADAAIESMRPRTKIGKAAAIAVSPFRTARAIMTMGDLPMLGQSAKVSLAHPVMATRQLGKTFKALRSREFADQVEESIRNRPNAPYYEQFKMLATRNGNLSTREEDFAERILEKIPGIRNIKAVTERGYTTYLNLIRADYFDYLADNLARGGVLDMKEAEALAKFVNVWTGRGNIGSLERITNELNTVMFAPRYFAAKWQAAIGQPLYGGTWDTRKLIAKEYAKTFLGLSAVLGLAGAAGARVELDPRSTDFGKARIGETRLDFIGGNLAPLVFMTRTALGEKKTTSGNVMDIRGERAPYGQGWSNELKNQLRYAASPLTATILNTAEGKNAIGQPVTLGSQFKDLTVPFFLDDSVKAMQEFGPVPGAALMVAAYFGVRINTHDKKQGK